MSTPLFPDDAGKPATSNAELHLRTMRVKLTQKLRGEKSYMKIAINARPDLNDATTGSNYIRNVWACRTADQTLTEAWEKAAGIEPQPQATQAAVLESAA